MQCGGRHSTAASCLAQREGGREEEGGRREEGGGMEGGGLAGQPLLIGKLNFKNSYLNSQSLRIIAPISIYM